MHAPSIKKIKCIKKDALKIFFVHVVIVLPHSTCKYKQTVYLFSKDKHMCFRGQKDPEGDFEFVKDLSLLSMKYLCKQLTHINYRNLSRRTLGYVYDTINPKQNDTRSLSFRTIVQKRRLSSRVTLNKKPSCSAYAN